MDSKIIFVNAEKLKFLRNYCWAFFYQVKTSAS